MKIAAAVVAATLLTPSIYAQTLSETIEVRVTNIDVVVTDRSGKPVTGLTGDDFEVSEAGKPQPITNFYEIRDSTSTNPVDGTETEAPVVPTEVGRRRIVIFVDNYSIHPLSRNAAFKALERSLDVVMRPGDEVMIAFWNGQQDVIAPFSGNKAELIRRFRDAASHTSGGMTIETVKARIVEHASQMLADAKAPGGKMKITVPQAYTASLESARNFSEELFNSEQNLLGGLTDTITTLAGVEGKKALIFLGSELPDNPGMELFQQIDGMFQFDMQGIRPAMIREQGRNLSRQLRALARHANANGVTLYMVDTADRVRGGDPGTHMMEAEAAFATETNTPLAMATIASLTGGIAVRGGKTFESAIDTIAHDLSSYYSIGYRSPAGGNGDRRITVKVKRPGLRVRSRSSYVARQGDDDIRDRVIANVYHSSVKSDFPVSIIAGAPERLSDGSGQFKVRLTVTLPSTLTFIPQDDKLTGEFAVFFATGKENGDLSPVSKAVQPMKFPGNAREALEAQKTFTYTAILLVRPGEQVVSVGVTDTLAGTTGFARTKLIAQ